MEPPKPKRRSGAKRKKFVIEDGSSDSDYRPSRPSQARHAAVQAALHVPAPAPAPVPVPKPLLPFRTPYKLVDVLNQGHATAQEIFKVHRDPKYIPKKQKYFQYWHVHGFNTWMIDIVFIKTDGGKFEFSDNDIQILTQADALEQQPTTEENARTKEIFNRVSEEILANNHCQKILLCIHCNSRLAKAYMIKDQKAITLIPCIKDLRDRFGCDTIISDAQGSISAAIREINTSDVNVARREIPIIKHICLNMSAKNNETFHTMLALVDRMCRTLRDMIYNVKFNNRNVIVDGHLLDVLCDIYNNVQHDRLTNVMGFPISPKQMFSNPKCQEEFLRRTLAHNYRVNATINNDLHIGEIVRVHNKPEPFKKRRNTVEDDEYEVVGYDGRYILRNRTTNKLGRYVRSQIVRY